MLKRIHLLYYRCFKNASLSFKDVAIIVGCNNAGKSTLIEALRMIAFAVRKCTKTTYNTAPSRLGLPAVIKGFRIATEQLKIDLRSVIYQFQENQLANIEVAFDNNVKIKIYIDDSIAFATMYAPDGDNVQNRNAAKQLELKQVNIMPQIGLIREDETRLTQKTVLEDMDTRLASRHFRNEILFYKDRYYEEFKRMAETTWNGLRIDSFDSGYGDDPISLIVYDAEFAAEIGQMGSGLQMWLQIIWFLSRCEPNSTVILDEPDAYMHPDMQRKVLKLVLHKFSQIIIATHSIEIISEVKPTNIVTVDKKTRYMDYSDNLAGVQAIVDNIGGVENLSLIRLGSCKKCVFIEGKDIDYLNIFYNVLNPNSTESLKDLPTVPLGGWSRFDEALGAARLFYDQTGGEIRTICILDRDYYQEDKIEELYQKAKENHLTLHVWNKKEIENYFVSSEIVFRVSKLEESKKFEMLVALEEEIEKFKDIVTDNIAAKIQENKHQLGVPIVNTMARKMIDARWTSLDNKMSMINGKDLVSTINKFLKEKYDISCSLRKLAASLMKTDILPEMREVIELIGS